MRRFDLLRSPPLLLSVGLLLLNDFVLKAAFHNWLNSRRKRRANWRQS